jgi:hypothetical protein
MAPMVFPLVVGICSLIVAAIFFWGGVAEEKRNESVTLAPPGPPIATL